MGTISATTASGVNFSNSGTILTVTGSATTSNTETIITGDGTGGIISAGPTFGTVEGTIVAANSGTTISGSIAGSATGEIVTFATGSSITTISSGSSAVTASISFEGLVPYNTLINTGTITAINPLSIYAEDLNLINFGTIAAQQDGEAIKFVGNSDGVIYNLGDIDGPVSISDTHQGDYLVTVPANSNSPTITQLGDSETSYEVETGEIFGILDSDSTSIILSVSKKTDGTDGNDIILGSATEKNKIKGKDGDDWIFGGEDKDDLKGGDGQDILFGGLGNDKLKGQDGFDYLNGGEGNDKLDGGKGVDILIGGLGKDHLEGGDGRDFFVFTNLNDSTSANRDKIKDFEQDEFDKIVFSDVDINGFDELNITTHGNKTIIEHINSDFEVELKGALDLTEVDFIFA